LEDARRSGVIGRSNSGSGVLPPPGLREDSDPEAVNLGGTPSPSLARSSTFRGSPSGKLVSPSGRLPQVSSSGPTSGRLRPEPLVDPHAETIAVTPATATPPEESRLPVPVKPAAKKTARPTHPSPPHSQWQTTLGMALLLLTVALLAAFIGYFIFTR